ncbi:UBA/TS-N domain protein [Oesophagostomum dentatum]|uniref:UBA/TS-N domain protein n=1 Tax=Oesophagostomum dentatum TaxID=61180 RepID=A0A0B1TFH4_OESDE|nr:UBA/TS-N domain protein [Oesophagostomum dentatum]
MQALGIRADDVLLVRLTTPLSTSSTGSSHTQPSQSTAGPINSNRLTELIKSIKLEKKDIFIQVPPKTTNPLRENARKIFDLMKNPAQRAHIYFKARPLVDQYTKDPNDFEAFCKAYEKIIEDEVKKARLMADPTSAEGQRLIQEQIQMENINYSYAQALEHTPEAYIPVHMLYIKMEINGHPVKAFVDSGAQVSILSEACARRCELSHLIDKRFTGTARGVGGFQKFVGKIHSCQVKVEDRYFPCNFDVMADREMDLLLGLNILKRHQCNINLKSNMYIHSHVFWESEFMVDNDLLTQAINLGFSEEDAKAALKMTRNDLEAALQQLFSKADERTSAGHEK